MSDGVRFRHVEERASQYDRHAQEDSWQADHEWSMVCFDFVELVLEGTDIYDSICRLDNDWRICVYRGDAEYDAAQEGRIVGLFAKWLITSESVLVLYSRIKKEYDTRGFDTGPIVKLASLAREVRGSMEDDTTFFAREQTFLMSRVAGEQHDQGKSEDADTTIGAAPPAE